MHWRCSFVAAFFRLVVSAEARILLLRVVSAVRRLFVWRTDRQVVSRWR